MKVPVGNPLWGDKEIEYALDALKRGEISGHSGPYNARFEKEFAAYCKVSHAVTCSNGTTALHLALATLKIGKGDEVLVSTLTNMASVFSILYVGAKPVAIDCESETYNMDPALIEKKITKRTKAIMVVHLYGHTADMDPILKIAKKHKLYVIEDAAEAHGALYKGRYAGAMGDMGCFSMYANKIITTGEGGMVTTNKATYAKRAQILKTLAFGKKNKFMHEDIGFNFRLTNIQAAIGCAQMQRIEEVIAMKQRMAAYYKEHLSDIESIKLPVERDGCRNVYWMYNIVLQKKLRGKREQFMQMLREKGVDTRPDFIPMNGQRIFIRMGLAKKKDCPVANYIGDNGLYLPSGTNISEIELAHVVKSVREVVATLTR